MLYCAVLNFSSDNMIKNDVCRTEREFQTTCMVLCVIKSLFFLKYKYRCLFHERISQHYFANQNETLQKNDCISINRVTYCVINSFYKRWMLTVMDYLKQTNKKKKTSKCDSLLKLKLWQVQQKWSTPFIKNYYKHYKT